MHFLAQSSLSFVSTWPNHLHGPPVFFRTPPTTSMPIPQLCTTFLRSQFLKEVPHIHITIRISVLSSIDAPSSLAMSHFHTSCSFGHSSHKLDLSVWATLLWKSRWETTFCTSSKHILPSQPPQNPLHCLHSPYWPNKTFPHFPEYHHSWY